MSDDSVKTKRLATLSVIDHQSSRQLLSSHLFNCWKYDLMCALSKRIFS